MANNRVFLSLMIAKICCLCVGDEKKMVLKFPYLVKSRKIIYSKHAGRENCIQCNVVREVMKKKYGGSWEKSEIKS